MPPRNGNPPRVSPVRRPPPPTMRIPPELFKTASVRPVRRASILRFLGSLTLIAGFFGLLLLVAIAAIEQPRRLTSGDVTAPEIAEASLQPPPATPIDTAPTMPRDVRDESGAGEPEASRLGETHEPQRRWSAGSTKAEVESIEGPPRAIERKPWAGEELWDYRYGNTVTFDAHTGTVVEWRNNTGDLRIGTVPLKSTRPKGLARKRPTAENLQSVDAAAFVVDVPDAGGLGEAPRPRESRLKRYWTYGSTKAVVAEIDGPPTSVHKYPALGYEEWSYNTNDAVKFGIPSGEVTEWRNTTGRLSVALTVGGEIAMPEPGACFGEGSTIEEVLRAQGTPRSLVCYPALGHMEWSYNTYDTIKFDVSTARVIEWENDSGSLHLRARN